MADVHKSYAAALFELAYEEKIEKEILEATKEFSNILKENYEYALLLSSPALDKKERMNLLKDAIGDNYPEILSLFLIYMCEKGIITEFDQMAIEYEMLYNEMQKLSLAVIKSAIELTEEEKQSIRTKIERTIKSKIIPQYVIDEEILGGIIVEADGKIFDGSLRKKISELKKVIEE